MSHSRFHGLFRTASRNVRSGPASVSRRRPFEPNRRIRYALYAIRPHGVSDARSRRKRFTRPRSRDFFLYKVPDSYVRHGRSDVTYDRGMRGRRDRTLVQVVVVRLLQTRRRTTWKRNRLPSAHESVYALILLLVEFQVSVRCVRCAVKDPRAMIILLRVHDLRSR